MPLAELQYMTDDLRKLRAEGLHQKLMVMETEQSAICRFDGQEVINLSSNNYLGLATHPKLKQRAGEAIERYGVGTCGVRTIGGNMTLHMMLEEKIASFKSVEAAVLFQGGFTANAGTIQTILTKDDIVISDELNHASLIDGCRLSGAKVKIFPHKDIEACEKILKGIMNRTGRRLLITDSVFSMEGDIAPLPELVDLAERYHCIMMIDDAHALGVLGRNGRGAVDHFNLHGRVDIEVGTLSKAVAAVGGYVCSKRDVIEFLHHRARPLLFSTSHPPSVAAACLAAFEVLEDESGRIQTLWSNTNFFKEGLKSLGFDTGVSETPITPVIVGDTPLAHEFSRQLFAAGIFAKSLGYPTVPRGRARVRTIVSATHSMGDLSRALEIFGAVGKQLKIIH